MLKSLIAAGLLAAAPAAPALAAGHGAPAVAAHVQIGVQDAAHRNYGRHDDRRDIDRKDAVRIASRQGVARVRDVDFRRGVWEVTGTSHRGQRIEVEIARDGRVIDVDYGRAADGRRR